MASRESLQVLFEGLLGSRSVYYQPPASVKMTFPAIIYSRNNIRSEYADNIPYTQYTSYEVTVVDRNPDSELVYKIAQLPMCRHNRHYTADNLNHDVFTLFY